MNHDIDGTLLTSYIKDKLKLFPHEQLFLEY